MNEGAHIDSRGQPQRPGRFHYRSKRSRFWRWDEQAIELLVHDHQLVLNGPAAVLAMLRARLLPPEDFAYLNKKGVTPVTTAPTAAPPQCAPAAFFMELVREAVLWSLSCVCQ